MTIPEIERAEAGIEVKAAAVSNLLPPVHRQAFELPLDGVLVMAATKIRSRLLITGCVLITPLDFLSLSAAF